MEGARLVHDSILDAIEGDYIQNYYTEHSYLKGEKWSIKCIGYFSGIFNGKDLKKIAAEGDEEYITKKLGKMKDRFPVVIPNAVMVHYGYSQQRKKKFDTDGKYLEKYKEMAQEVLTGLVPE